MPNAEKITQPTTSEITESVPPRANRGSGNARVDGIYASGLELGLKSAEDFQRLHMELKKEFKPDGRHDEEKMVLAIARNIWLRHRLHWIEKPCFRTLKSPAAKAERKTSRVTNNK